MMAAFEAYAFEYIAGALALFVLYLLYYVYTKDAEHSRNIRSIASVADELSKELYYLKQKLSKTQEELSLSAARMGDEAILGEIEREVYDAFAPLAHDVKRLHEELHAQQTQFNHRITQLESGVKQISIPLSVHGNDDEKIIALFQQGIPLETISKELHISKPEVEFVLKINKLK